MGLAAGMKVNVKQLGRATVVKVTRDGALVELDSARGLEVEMPSYDLEIIEGNSTQTTTKRAIKKAQEETMVQAFKSLEALRFGLVPEGHIQSLTMGYDRLKAWAEKCFRETCKGNPHVYEITGPFGTGKSHTMSVIRQLAGAEGYLTARVEVDGKNVSLAEPDQLLYMIWLTLTGPKLISDTPLLDIYSRAMENGYYKVPTALKKSDLFAANYESILKLKQLGLLDKYALLVEEALSSSDGITATRIKDEIGQESIIKKSEIYLKPVKAKRKEGRPRNFIESLAGHALIAQAAGYKGLVLTIDEFEVEYNMAQGAFAQLKQVIYLLTSYLNGETDLPMAPLAIFFATVGQDGHRGDILVEDMVSRSGGDTFVLKPWSTEQRLELAQRIFSLYQQAYELETCFEPLLPQKIEQLLIDRGYGDGDLIRMFIKWYMAMLDLKFGPGRHNGEYQ